MISIFVFTVRVTGSTKTNSTPQLKEINESLAIEEDPSILLVQDEPTIVVTPAAENPEHTLLALPEVCDVGGKLVAFLLFFKLTCCVPIYSFSTQARI